MLILLITYFAAVIFLSEFHQNQTKIKLKELFEYLNVLLGLNWITLFENKENLRSYLKLKISVLSGKHSNSFIVFMNPIKGV